MNKQKRIRWTTELIDEHLKEHYPWVYLIPGQEYVNSKIDIWFYCTTPGHPPYKAKMNNIQNPKIGCQCPRCADDRRRASKYEITKEFVGVTTIDGHTILEHIGYYQSPNNDNKDRKAIYRYKCAVCGDENGIAQGAHLKMEGRHKSCGCQASGKDSIQGFENQDGWANSDCYVYIADVDSKYIKPGITNNLNTRASMSEGRYNDYLFVSPKLSRCEAWAIEQNLLSLTSDAMPTLDELPDEYFNWGGKTELRIKDMFSLNELRWKFDGLYRQLQKIGWRELALTS